MSEKHTHMDQRRAPIHEALENFRRMRVVPFDVPGHAIKVYALPVRRH